MDVIDVLMNEHRHIGRVLDLLDRAMEQAREGKDISPVLFERTAHFFLTFVDVSHAAKENELFRAITTQGLPLGQGVLAVLSGQHVLGREQAEALREAARSAQRPGVEPEEMYLCAHHYVHLLRAHTEVEEQRLFPLVRRLLPMDTMERVRAKFARIEAAHGPLVDAVDVLERAFPLPGPRAQSRGGR
jgi:hemerythrin-like domain-containing protein